ncbi:hypothetical protein BN946_scf184969.g50 [Trametes cinnabarina]|uniref:Dynactin subunit 2 n=1 Tax=Pycnoporus cinnabarinus TaxID=5643 RepID=A0A060SZL1_PYCCI|nr:hypothetical protein BN946_scf184969.g50 [Trametes cinnabarina]
MSATKYANLPDIDTAPDVYETEDVFPTAQDSKGDSSEDEANAPARGYARGKAGEASGREELDASSVDPEEATKKFRRAEKTEVAALETELSDPTNPLLRKEQEAGHADPGELIRGMVDVKRRIEKISKAREGRGKLVSVVLGESDAEDAVHETKAAQDSGRKPEEGAKEGQPATGTTKVKVPEVRDIAEMDRRVGELEKVVGSSSAALDEVGAELAVLQGAILIVSQSSPLPPPLLPLLTRLNAQLTLLTQPRHIDSISRRIKLLNAELERTSSANNQAHSASQRRGAQHPSAQGQSASSPSASAAPATPTASSVAMQEQLAPVLSRLAPLLPHIPHILTRLRTLSALHTSAAGFEKTLESLEEEQRRTHAALEELQRAVEGVEKSLAENETLVKGNVRELEDRIEDVGRRMDDLKHSAS